MSPVHIIEFFIFSLCIHIFSVFTYVYYYSHRYKNLFNKETLLNYDYIIVGSGTSGSLIAHRLATETNFTFIVLEAGGESHYFHNIPAFGPLLHGSVYDWQYETISQEHACFAMKDQKCRLTQGKILGGSAKLNNMIHVSGNTSHYVEWFHGKYSKKFIEEQLSYIEKNIFHLDNIQYLSKFSEAVLDGAKELGYDNINDFNKGFMKPKVTQWKGQRWTTSDNLNMEYVKTNTKVESLLITDNTCYGVRVSGNPSEIYAKRGVILAAGTFNSPKILQLSGIGPADLLKSFDIPVIKSLPVGDNLQDHIGTGLDLVLFDNLHTVGMWNILNLFSLFAYFFHGNGAFTTTGCEALGFLSTKDLSTPDIQFMILPVGISADRGSHLKNILGITDKTWYGYFSKLFNKNPATIFPLLLQPKSKGYVKIQSIDANKPPLINPRYFSDNVDVQTLKQGLKLVKMFIETKSLKEIGAHLNTVPFPGCDHFKFFSDEYLECYIKHLTLSSYHPVGTCSMGSLYSNSTVVDTSFKVLGIDNLYVVDASVLPTLPSANINAAIAMMASIFFEDVIKRNKIQDKDLYCDKINPFLV